MLVDSLISKQEILLVKVILDCQYHFYSKIDNNSIALFKLLSILEYFLSHYLNTEEVKLLISELKSSCYKRLYKELNMKSKHLLELKVITKEKHELYYKNLDKESYLY